MEASKSFVEIKLDSVQCELSQAQDKVKAIESEHVKLLGEKNQLAAEQQKLQCQLDEARSKVSHPHSHSLDSLITGLM